MIRLPSAVVLSSLPMRSVGSRRQPSRSQKGSITVTLESLLFACYVYTFCRVSFSEPSVAHMLSHHPCAF